MSNTQTKSKSKMSSGTIAIIALSIVLVLSLVTTITLAYFTASRNVITTIQFANGVRLQMAGAYSKAATSVEDTPPSIGPVELYWKAAYGAKSGASRTEVPTTGDADKLDTTTGTYSQISEKLYFEDLKVRVLDLNAYVAIRVEITAVVTDGGAVVDMTTNPTGLGAGYVKPVMAAEWQPYTGSTSTSSNSYGWFAFNASNAVAQMPKSANNDAAPATRDSTTGFHDVIVDWAIEPDNNIAGKTLICKVIVYASNTLQGLNDQIDAYNANPDSTADPAVAVAAYDDAHKVGYAAATVAP